jgi:hypothetical protein
VRYALGVDNITFVQTLALQGWPFAVIDSVTSLRLDDAKLLRLVNAAYFEADTHSDLAAEYTLDERELLREELEQLPRYLDLVEALEQETGISRHYWHRAEEVAQAGFDWRRDSSFASSPFLVEPLPVIAPIGSLLRPSVLAERLAPGERLAGPTPEH